MGYYANYNGAIRLKNIPPAEILSKGDFIFENFCFDKNDNLIDLGGYDKYYEDSVYEFLDEIKTYVKNGTIEYTGDDGCIWRFIFINNDWVEQNGTIVYEENVISPHMKDEFIGQIIDIFDDELSDNKATFIGDKYDHVSDKLTTLLKAWRVF